MNSLHEDSTPIDRVQGAEVMIGRKFLVRQNDFDWLIQIVAGSFNWNFEIFLSLFQKRNGKLFCDSL